MAKKYRDVRRALRNNGFRHLRTTGSHEVWEHADGRRVVLAGAGKDNRDVPAGTLKAIRQQTGINDLR
ncbi:MAG: type II toxin-antitoxin system HicA family toxin [Solirubrobacteraceae bacterium]